MDKLEETILLLVIHFGVILAVSADLNCTSEAEMLKLQEQCFTDQGIQITLPTYTTDDSKSSHKKSYMNAVIAQKAELLCAQQEEFQEGLHCAMTHTRSCMPLEYQGFVPEPSRMSQFVSTLCNQSLKVDFECAKKNAASLYDCGIRKGQEVFRDGGLAHTTKNILCKAFEFNAECQVSELKECGCHTVRSYQVVSLDLLYPPSCPPLLDHRRVQCLATNEFLFADVADGGVCDHVALSLLISVVFIFCELFVL